MGVEVAVAAGDKDTTRTRQTVEGVTCPTAVMLPDIQDSVFQVLRQDKPLSLFFCSRERNVLLPQGADRR